MIGKVKIEKRIRSIKVRQKVWALKERLAGRKVTKKAVRRSPPGKFMLVAKLYKSVMRFKSFKRADNLTRRTRYLFTYKTMYSGVFIRSLVQFKYFNRPHTFKAARRIWIKYKRTVLTY